VVFFGLNWYVSNFTVAGDILSRFGETRLVNGIPDSRAEVWPQAVERMMLHPFIGSGPYYSPERGLHVWYWPHNLILYIGNIVGLFGLGAFLWIMWRLWKLSTPRTDRLNDPSYLKAFQLAAHVMLVIFFVDELKIEYLRNPNYQFQPWVLFGMIVAAAMIARDQTAPAPAVAPMRARPSQPLPSGSPART
jgi:hypothetical protein